MAFHQKSCNRLISSCEERLTRVVRCILEASPQLINCVGLEGVTPIIASAERGASKKLIALLTEYGADLHIRDRFGRTALYAGISSLSIAAIELILAAGADPNVETTNSETPLTSSIVFNRSKVLALLLKYGADPNYRCKDGGTAAYYAVYEKRPSLLKRLLEAGAEVGDLGPRNTTLLEWSRDKKSRSLIIQALARQRDQKGS